MVITIYLLVVAFVICFVFRNEIIKKNEIKTESVDKDSFLKLVKVFSVIDEEIVRSMLESAEIVTKSDSTNFQRVQFGNLTSCLYGINIYVKQEDAIEAKIIVIDFIRNKSNCIINNKNTAKRKLSKLFFEPALHKDLPELLI